MNPATMTRDDRLAVAQTIIDQIGRGVRIELGVKDMVALECGVQFKITGRGGRKRAVIIELNALDLYDVRMESWRGVLEDHRVDHRAEHVGAEELPTVLLSWAGLL